MQIIAITIPIFLFVAIGYFSKLKGLINDHTRNFLSKLTYYVTFPALTFRSIMSFDFASTFRLNLVACNFLVTITVFVLTFFLAFLIRNNFKRGAFNMSCYRSNQGYMGLPVVNGFYGEQAMSRAAVIGGFDVPTVIILSVLGLVFYKENRGISVVFTTNDHSAKDRLFHIMQSAGRKFIDFFINPFILSAFFGLLLAYYKVPVLQLKVLDQFLLMASNISLPMALVLIGCSVDVKHLRNNKKLVLSTTFIKLLVMPVIAYLLAYFVFNMRGTDLGMSVILTAMPSAVSTYVMAAEMETDAELAATVIGFSTFISVITISVIQFALVRII
jgi:predicted permease